MGINDLEWSDKFSTDILSIDRQHQELLFLTQQLLQVLEGRDSTLADKQTAFKSLVDHALAHFAYEERIMRNIAYPGRDKHILEHDELRAEIDHMLSTVLKGEGAADWKGLTSLVQVWLLRHIVSTDTLLREHIQRETPDMEDGES